MDKLGKYCKIISGYAFKSNELSEGTDIPVIKIGNISNGNDVIIDNSIQYVSKDFLSIDKKYHVVKGDVLISLTGSHINQPNSMVGRSCRNFSDTEFLLNQRAGKVIPNDNADKDYLYYLLNTESFKYSICNRAYGAANQANISPSDIEGIKWDFPSLPTQQKIASILSAYDNLIENNNKRIKILEQMAENLYKEWFVRFRFPDHETTSLENGIPKGWSIAPFSQNADVMSGGTLSTDNPNYYDGCIPFFTPKDCDDSFFVFETITNITEDGLNHCNSQLYPENTIAITARGTVGNVALFAYPMAMNQSCFALKSDKLNNQYYLFFAIKNEVLKLKKMANGGVFDTIVVKSFDHIPLTIPSEDVLKKFERLITPIMKAIREIQISSNNLIKQRDLLLPRLMSGKLAV